MENQADKSQEATPYKLDEAKKKGQVGRSAEFVSTFSLCVMCIGLCISISKLAHVLSLNTIEWFKNVNKMVLSPKLIPLMMKAFLGNIMEIVGAIMVLGIMASILSSFIHIGPIFSLHPLKFDFLKLNPVNGLKKIFSIRGLVDIFKSVLKILFFSVALYFVWAQIKNKILYPSTLSMHSILENWKSAFNVLIASMLIVYIIFALFDLWYSKREFAKKMRMSVRDIKDEYRRREGDPELKNKRKKTLIEMLRNIGGAAKIKNADVIITNPTHVAVALQYRSKTMALPIVVAKGKGLFARFIIKRAKKNGIPIYRIPPLARKIYAESSVNNVIPVSEQQKIAEVYRDIVKMPDNKVFS